ncbi:IQ motif-containing protein H isoform X1 [Stegostoma tigrinum]|uniref:IQ motif-containing protein H isoform X1 n=3 Tax=Stegostoma tigrinum TaxID=3053191 RepID=UPI00286FCFFA|nr:IQ motif-containing protein H isoform X1 [Stegostoma tigrinum]
MANSNTDVGHVLVKVQEDLQELKEKITNITIHGKAATVNIQTLETAIRRTEMGLKNHAAAYLNVINNQVLTLPAVEYRDMSAAHPLPSPVSLSINKIIKKPVVYPSLNKKHHGIQLWNAPKHISPGTQHKHAMDMRILCDPTNPKNRNFLHQNYGIQLPFIKNEIPDIPPQKLIKGSTVGTLAVLPASHRENPSLLPPFVSEKDARKGILSLIERGLIPPASELTVDPPFVQNRAAKIHDIQEKHRKPAPEVFGTYPKNAFCIVVSESYAEETKYPDKKPESKLPLKMGTVTPAPSFMSRTSTKDISAVQHLHGKGMVPFEFHQPKQFQVLPVHRPQEFSETFYVTIFNGKIDHTAPDILAFKQHYQLYWGHILSFLEYLETKLRQYDVPVAIVEGQKLAEISAVFELNSQPNWKDLLPVVKNRELVEEIIKRPGQQYRGPDGLEIAATKIQAIWRQYQCKTKYLIARRQKWAAGVISISWLMRAQRVRVKKTLKQSRQRHLENFRSRAKHLAANWNRIKASRRTIIHIPSLGYAQSLRSSVPNIDTQQNLQMGRLCDIRDDNVDVIYICPLWIGEDVTQYYMNLLGLQEAIKTGKPEKVMNVEDRLKVMTPEAISCFPNHHLCLATHLKYSPKTIKRIKNLIEGKAAYIVGGLLHKDDLAVADMLNVPILGPEPEVAHLYSTKSGSKRIFASASVPMPPGEYDIYNLRQMHEVLTQLILENLEIKRWLFKLDVEFGGRGTAYFDVLHLKCYKQILKEFRGIGPTVWLKKKWIQEPSELKLSRELPGILAEHAQPANKKIFPTWEKFVEMFLCQGGVVEAYPPSDSVTNLTIDMLIEPTGEVSMVSCGDQIHSNSPLECWGTTVPQCSVNPGNLHSVCVKIAEACKCRGIIGFFSIDLVTFIHPLTMEQQVWATDLDLAYSDQLAMTQLMLFISNGKLTCKTNTFEVSPKPRERKQTSNRKELAMKERAQIQLPFMKRYGVLSTQLKHTNLSIVHYSVLFKIFKVHGIGFDIKERQGTVFILHEDNKKDRLGMVTIGEDLQGALLTFARNLSVIHQEITAPNMQLENNFQAAIKDIELILGVTIVNKSCNKEEHPTTALEALTGRS